MEEIEYILGEGQAGGSIEGHEFSESLSNFWVSVQELSKDPTSSVNQNLFVTRAYEFVTRASAVYKSLEEYQENLNESVLKEVDNINKYALQIEELNQKIVSIEAGQNTRMTYVTSVIICWINWLNWGISHIRRIFPDM